jgi:formamidopyrimidine-DNA glycosylase
MSVELPEARILAEQMNAELPGKKVQSIQLRDYERMQKIGFMNKDLKEYDRLIDGTVTSVTSRGNTVLTELDNGMNLLIAPEYGGRVLNHEDGGSATAKYHLRLDFEDGTALTVRLTSMGVIQAVDDAGLRGSYVYKRDFSDRPSPGDEGFTLERFAGLLAERNQQLKQVLVGKEAVVVGLSNSAFQDVLFQAGLHPRRKASSLDEDEVNSLHGAIATLIRERLRLGGKDRFQDLYGAQGRYVPAMGPNMKGQLCPVCGTGVERLSIGGGQVYLCPECQK